MDGMLADELKPILHGDVADDEATLAKYSRDYSIFKVRPQAVVFPKDTGDLKALVKFAAEKKASGEEISLTGRSAGTDMTGGPLNGGIIVSFTKYFNHIKDIADGDPADMHVDVEPGVYFRDLEKELDARGLLYPAYPASKELCAIGGMVNNNSGGELTLAYGKTERYVRELKVVLADGEEHVLKPLSEAGLREKLAEKSFEGDVYRRLYALLDAHYAEIEKARPDVSKNSAGYGLWNVWDKDKKTFDITKLFVGSQGTLGLLAEARLGLVKREKYSRLAVIFLRSLDPVGALVNELLKFHPESLESYDDKTMEVAVKLWRPVLRSMKGNVVKLAWQFLPEVFMVLRHGMPKMIMLAELASDDEEALAAKIEELRAAVARFGETHPGVSVRALRNEGEAEKYWTIRRESFALLHGAIKNKDTAPFIDDFIVKPEYLPEVLPKVNAILDQYKEDLIYTIAGHPGNGNFHIIPLMDLRDPRVRALIPKISDEVYRLVFQYHGSITAEHNDGIIRTPYLDGMYGSAITALFAEVKKIFDPEGIFNPGKKTGGTLEYAIKHIAPTSQ